MSKDAAMAFLKKVSEDANLQEKILAFAAQEGYQFTVEELSEAELGDVAGGLLNTISPSIAQFKWVPLTETYKIDTALPALNTKILP